MMKDIQYFLNTKKKNHMDISTIVVEEKSCCYVNYISFNLEKDLIKSILKG